MQPKQQLIGMAKREAWNDFEIIDIQIGPAKAFEENQRVRP